MVKYNPYFVNTQFANLEDGYLLGFYSKRETASRFIDILAERCQFCRKSTIVYFFWIMQRRYPEIALHIAKSFPFLLEHVI